jgi:hypothetical protein
MSPAIFFYFMLPLSVSLPLEIPFQGGFLVIDVGSASTFRLGVRLDGLASSPLFSPSLDPNGRPAPSKPISWPGGFKGLSTSYGQLLANPAGEWVLTDSNNVTLVSSRSAPFFKQNTTVSNDGGVVIPVAAGNLGPTRPCLGNGFFGSPFFFNSVKKYAAFGVPGKNWDPSAHHCLPVDFSGSFLDVVDVCNPGLVHSNMSVTGAVASAQYPGGEHLSQSDCCSACGAAGDCIGFLYNASSDPSISTCFPISSFASTISKKGLTWSGPLTSPAPQNSWLFVGSGSADVYLAPAESSLMSARTFYQLTGATSIPPKYAFGFMATYWGYKTMEEVEGNMTRMRDGKYPIDSFIMDYDWWKTSENKNQDFGYDQQMFGFHSFTHPPGSSIPNATTNGPASLFEHFTKDLSMHWSGIRYCFYAQSLLPLSLSPPPISSTSSFTLTISLVLFPSFLLYTHLHAQKTSHLFQRRLFKHFWLASSLGL